MYVRATSFTLVFSAVFLLAALLISLQGSGTAFPASVLADSAPASPVLVELFTSEGCSSCPPADAILQKLDQFQPIKGAQAIVLSEHVDYWNHDGWKDAYSSSFFTERQENYVRRLQVKEPYTPQMVVDGVTQQNGSDVRAIGAAITTARDRKKVLVRISSYSFPNPKTLQVHVQSDALPEASKARKADIFVALALDHAASHVAAGENKGRDISHVAVVESINKVGTVEKGKTFDRDVEIKLKSPADPANFRLIAFVQEPDEGEVLGASLLNPSPKVSPSQNVGPSQK